LKKFPRPVELYASNHRAEVDAGLCNACGACAERCQLAAIAVMGDAATVNPDRCIGCGNCVVVCTAQALRLRKREEERLPPRSTNALYMSIMANKIPH
jgi:electron transport complex protein RnfB